MNISQTCAHNSMTKWEELVKLYDKKLLKIQVEGKLIPCGNLFSLRFLSLQELFKN